MQNYSTIIGIIDMRLRGFSKEDVMRRFQKGSSTVQLIMERYKYLGIPLCDLKTMNPKKVESAFYPDSRSRSKKVPLPDYEKVYQRRNAKGSKANLYFQWKEYKLDNPDGYQYTQYVEHYNRYVEEHYGITDVSMAVERVPGERIFIDWVGDQPAVIVDRETGELRKVHVFVTTVGVSSKLYAELFPDERENSFIKGTVHAIEFYGATPRYLIPDNTRTAVTRHTKDELILNSAYQDLESFYDVVILPPPPRKPKGYLQTQIIFKNRREQFKHCTSAIWF